MPRQVQITIGGRVDPSLNESFGSAIRGLDQIGKSLSKIERLGKLFSFGAQNDIRGFSQSIIGATLALETLRRGYERLGASFRAYTGASYAEWAAVGMGGAAVRDFTRGRVMPIVAGTAKFAGIAAILALAYENVKGLLAIRKQQQAAGALTADETQLVERLGKALREAVDHQIATGRMAPDTADNIITEMRDAWLQGTEAAAQKFSEIFQRLDLPSPEKFEATMKDLELQLQALAGGFNLVKTTPGGESLAGRTGGVLVGPGSDIEQQRQMIQLRRREILELDQAYNDSLINQEEYWKRWVKIQSEIIQGERAIGLMEKQISEQRHQAIQQMAMHTSQMLGSFADLARTYGKKGFAAWKSLAIAQAIVNTYAGATGAYRSLADIPKVGPILGAIAAGMAVASGLANVAVIARTTPSGFALGGRPSLGELSIVGERGPELFVPDTAGTIVPNHQLAAAAAGNVNIAIVRSYADAQDYIASAAGQAAILDIVGRNRHRIYRTV